MTGLKASSSEPGMLRKGERSAISLGIILVLVAGGIVLLAIPVSVEENGPVYSVANVSANELNVPVGYAPPSNYAAAQISSGREVTVVITVLLGTASAEIFRNDFPAGTFEVSKVSVGNGGTVFLSVESKSGAFTQLSVYVRIFHYITTYPYAWIGLVVFCFTGLLTLATRFRNTSFGRIAGKILPVGRLGL